MFERINKPMKQRTSLKCHHEDTSKVQCIKLDITCKIPACVEQVTLIANLKLCGYNDSKCRLNFGI